MRDRLQALRRLGAVFGMVEEMHSTEARGAALAVTEAQVAIQAEATRTHEARQGGREALLTDDCLGWSLAVVHEEVALRRRARLAPLLEEREERHEIARERYVASRLRNEQMKSLVEDASAQIATEEERRSQAFADDRFLSRRERIRRREMNLS